MSGSYRVAVVTPEREVLALDARFVALPAFDGEMGILARRAPMLVQLGSGLLRIQSVEGEARVLFVSGGFAQMVEDRLTVLSQEARELSELSAEAAREALASARELPADSDEAWRRKQRATDRARAEARLSPRG